MKNLLILASLLSLICFSACGQKNPPENIKKEFVQKFPGAKSVKWDTEEANEWEAEFSMKGKEMTASFDINGKWLETESELKEKDLPAAVSNTLKNEFAGYKIDECSTVENSELKGFEVALKKKEENLTVILAEDGTVLKKEISAEKEEK